jgi:hypothetical protein
VIEQLPSMPEALVLIHRPPKQNKTKLHIFPEKFIQEYSQPHYSYYIVIKCQPKCPSSDKQNVIYTHKWVLFIRKEEWHTNTFYVRMNLEHIKWKQLEKYNTVSFYLYEMCRRGKSIETESRLMASRHGRRKKCKWLLNGYRISLWVDRNVLELGSGYGYTTQWIY